MSATIQSEGAAGSYATQTLTLDTHALTEAVERSEARKRSERELSPMEAGYIARLGAPGKVFRAGLTRKQHQLLRAGYMSGWVDAEKAAEAALVDVLPEPDDEATIALSQRGV